MCEFASLAGSEHKEMSVTVVNSRDSFDLGSAEQDCRRFVTYDH